LKVFNPDDPFFVDWDAFYRAIDKALVADGFERYKDWAVQIAEDPDIVKSQPPKKRQASEELENLPDWFRSATATKPATKKPKKEDDEKVRSTLLPLHHSPHRIESRLSINFPLHTLLNNL
jgi:hypothetical protein